MRKPTELIEEATKAGCETITDFVAWSYTKGQADTLDEVTKDIKEIVEDETPEFLKDDFVPKSVIHHTNKED